MAKSKNTATIEAPMYKGALPPETDVSQETTVSQEMVNQSVPETTTPEATTPETEIVEATPSAVTADDLADEPEDTIVEATPEEKPSEVGMVKELFFGRPNEVKTLYPRGCVKWESLFPEDGFNIRDPRDSYTPESLSQMIISLSDFGQEEAMMLSLQSDGRRKILRGHRRYAAMKMQRDEDIKMIAVGKLEKNLCRWQYVRAEVKSGLTLDQETVLMLDHGQRVGLRPPEIFNATKRLKNLGWTETQIRRKLGFSKEQRSIVTTHYKAACLTREIQEEYAKHLAKDKTAIKLSAPVVNELFIGRTADRKAGLSEMGGGPNLKAAWDKVKRENGNGQSRSAGAKKNAESLLDRCQDEHPLLMNLVNHILGNNEKLPNLDDIVRNISRACNAMFPQSDDPEVKMTEEGITREV